MRVRGEGEGCVYSVALPSLYQLPVPLVYKNL